MMAGQNVYFAMMSRDNPDIETQIAMSHAWRELERAGIPYKFKFIRSPSLIQRARNQFVADFLQSDCTDLVMIDDDVIWEQGAVTRLLSHPCEVVGGIYPKREDPLQYPVRRLKGAPFDPETGLMEVELLPTGFLRVTRNTLEWMVQTYSDLAYRDPDVPGGVAHALFWVDIEDDPDVPGVKSLWGEDFSFCRKVRRMGGRIHADLLLRFKHRGGKSYEGCYAETLPVSELIRRAAE
jgi:hypothetical protein